MKYPIHLFGALLVATPLPRGIAAAISADPQRHALYLEALGKGGLWGIGYDYLLNNRVAVGSTGSLYFLDGQRITTLSPYLNFYPAGSAHSRLMIQAGPQFVQQSTASTVPEWSGISTTKISGQIGTGWEFRSNALFRIYGMIAAGKTGIAPWAGLTAGWTF